MRSGVVVLVLWMGVSCGGQLALAQAGGPSRPGASHAAVPSMTHAAPVSSPTPLSPRERVVQLLNRFTYGPRPGEVDRVLALGEDAWLAQQLAPETVKEAALDRRLADYPTLNMTPAQALGVFPDRGQIEPVANGRAPYPTDPLENAVYKLQVVKWQRERDLKKPDAAGKPLPEPSDEEKAASRKKDQATAARVAGVLFSLPCIERMAALIGMPMDDQIAVTGNGNLGNEQRTALVSQFTPRERETFVAMGGQVSSSGNIANELSQARLLREVLSERQLQTVMTNFWFNHFNVFIAKDSDQWYTTSYEREVIRRHALGKFGDLLLATAESPAMMVYLDNGQSIGPDSPANGVNPNNPKSKRGNRGLNENYGREVMELHTVGVNGGYAQADVTALAAILTGWGVAKPGAGDAFSFDARKHEPGTKTWFGYRITDDGEVTRLDTGKVEPWSVRPEAADDNGLPAQDEGFQQGVAALRLLAASPKTAHFISWKLAQYFVADDPPSALVDRLTAVYLSSGGDIKAILRSLIASPEFNSRHYFHTKVKTPEEFLASTFRATATDPQNPGAMLNTLRQMGMEPYRALPPTGYVLTADHWMNSVALVDRLNVAYQLTDGKFANQKFDAAALVARGVLSGGSEAVAPAGAEGFLTGRARPFPAGFDVSSARAHGSELAPGTQTALYLLEATVMHAPVSAKTNGLIMDQVGKQAADASAASPVNPTDTLNLLAALILGSPDFQLR